MAKPPVLLRYRIGAGLILTAVLPSVVALGFSMFDGIAGRSAAILIPLVIAGVAASKLDRIGGHNDHNAGPELHDPLSGLVPLAAPFLLSLVLVAWPGIQGGLLLHQLRSVAVGPISVADFAEHPEAHIVELDDARIAMAQRGEVVSTTSPSEPDDPSGNTEVVEHLYAVAPLVGADWTETDEVVAWLILDDPDPAQLEGPVTVIRQHGRAEHREAQALAIEHHHLVSDPDAPLVELQSEQPRALARIRLRFLMLVNASAVALWLSISMAVWRRRRKAARKAAGGRWSA